MASVEVRSVLALPAETHNPLPYATEFIVPDPDRVTHVTASVEVLSAPTPTATHNPFPYATALTLLVPN
jgi:hypothetical protein